MSGHSSVEDALASLELAVMKIKNGRSFGYKEGPEGSGSVLDAFASSMRCVVIGGQSTLSRSECNDQSW
jgi:hypothetical protein